MSIQQITTSQTGLVGVYPRVIYIATNDTEAAILASGYLNQAVQNGQSIRDGDMALVITKTSASSTDVSSGWFQVNYIAPNWSLAAITSPGNVTLPTIIGHIATYLDVNGGLGEDPATAITGGNLQAGLSGTAGTLTSYPVTAAKGKLRITAANNAGDTTTVITTASFGQATTLTIPDPGVASATFVLSDGSTQQIATGNLQTLTGNMIAGSSGHAGFFESYPATAANGHLFLAATNAGGAFDTTISNGTMGQSSVITIPDPGAATANFILSKNGTTQTISSGSLALSAGTLTASGAITSSGGILTSGASTGGVVGEVVLFPTTASTGSLTWKAVPNSGNTSTIFQTAALGQGTTYTVPDPAGAAGAIAVAAAALVSGNLIQASGTVGLIADSGVATAAVQLKANIKAAQVTGLGGGGAGPITVSAAGAVSTSVIVVSILASSNTVSVSKVVPGTGNFALTLSADPGATLSISYVMFIAAQ